MSKIFKLLRELGIAIAKALSEKGKTHYRPANGTWREELAALPEDVLGMITLYVEARGEPNPAKMGIANVILNRTNSKGFPGTVPGVILQKNQISTLRPGNPNFQIAVSLKDCYEAWVDAASSEDNTNGAISYHDDSIKKPKTAYWSSLKECARIGRLIFYKKS